MELEFKKLLFLRLECFRYMVYLIAFIFTILFVLLGVFQLIFFKPNRTDQRGKEITKKRLVIFVGFFSLCAVVIFTLGYNTQERKEANYLNSVFKEVNTTDRVMKEFGREDVNEENIEEIVQQFSEIQENIKELEPPKTLPESVTGSQDTLEDGMDKLINGVSNIDPNEVEKGQAVIYMSVVLFEQYVKENRKVEKLIKDEYLDNFFLDN